MSNGIIDENGLKEAIFSIILATILVVIIKGVKSIITTVVAILFILFFRRLFPDNFSWSFSRYALLYEP